MAVFTMCLEIGGGGSRNIRMVPYLRDFDLRGRCETKMWLQHTQCESHRFYRQIEIVKSGLIRGNHLQDDSDSFVDMFLVNLKSFLLALTASEDVVHFG